MTPQEERKLFATQMKNCPPKLLSMMKSYLDEMGDKPQFINHVDELSVHRDFVRMRMKRTYERLKAKGLCFDTIGEMMRAMVSQKLNLFMAVRVFWECQEVVIPKQVWYDAFDLVILRHAPGLMDDLSCPNFAGVLQNYYEELWSIVIAVYNAKMLTLVVKDRLSPKEKEDLVCVTKERDQLKERNAVLISRQEALMQSNEKLRGEAARNQEAKQKELLSLDAEHRDIVETLQKKIRILEQENSLLQQALLAAEGAEEEDHIESEPADNEVVADWSEIELPKTNVLFLGGHTNLVKKLKEQYPDWTYLGDETKTKAKSDRKVDICFFWSKHLSHRAVQIIRGNIMDDYPTVYVEATNLRRLEQEMKRGYAEVMGLKESAQSMKGDLL